MSQTPAMTPQQAALTDPKKNPLVLYKQIAVGKCSWLYFILFELITLWISGLPGIVGLGLRSCFYPLFFKRCGNAPAIGRGVVIRQPNAITLGSRVIIDDYASIDVRGSDGQIFIGDRVSIGRFSTITAKSGAVILQGGVNIGSYTRLATQSKIEVGESTLIAAYVYIGAGNHQSGKEDVPMIARDMDIRGGVTIGRHCWIGAGAMILDGVTIGDGAIVGAQSLVNKDVPAGAIVAGTPARALRKDEGKPSDE